MRADLRSCARIRGAESLSATGPASSRNAATASSSFNASRPPTTGTPRARRSAFASCSASQRPTPRRDQASHAAMARSRAPSAGGAASAAATATPVRRPAIAGTPASQNRHADVVVEQLRQRRRHHHRHRADARRRRGCRSSTASQLSAEWLGDPGRAVVEHEHVADRRVLADGRGRGRAASRPRPRSSPCSRAGSPTVAAAGSRSRSAADGVRRERRQRRRRARAASSAPSPESPPEHVRIARPPPRGRAPGTASALASSSRSCTSAAHAAPASSTSARKTRWSPATAPVWAAAAAAPAADAPTFSTATPTPLVGAHRERLAQPRAVAVGLDEQRDRAHARLAREALDPVRRGRPPPRCRYETAVCRRSPRRVASALTTRLPLWETSATCPGSGAASASPHSAARECSEISPSQFGPQTGSDVPPRGGGAARLRAPRPPATRRSPAREDHRAAAAERARLLDRPPARPPPGSRPRPRPAPPGGRPATESTGRRAPTTRPRVDAPDLALEAEPPQVEQRLGGVRLRAARWRRRRRPNAGAEQASPLVQGPLDAAALERARDDQPLDLARPLPDAVDAQLAQEPLGDVGAHVAAAAEHLHARGRRTGRRPRSRTASPSTPWRARSSGRRPSSASRATSSVSARPAAASAAESASGNETPW